MTLYSRSTALLFLILMISSSVLRTTDAFASWLKCFVEFDPSEVIMMNRIIPAEKARHSVSIEVQPYGSSSGEWLSANENNDVLQLPPPPHPSAPLTLRVRLNVPRALEHEDVQFVIELKTSTADVAAEAVEFIDRGVMCDGSRAFSRRHDEHVILQLDLAAHPHLEYVALTAAWAPGMEAVTLTPTLTLKPTVIDEGSHEL